MRIGINALFWLPGQTGGSEVYLLELLRVWHETRADEVVVFSSPAGAQRLRAFDRWRHVVVPYRETSRADRIIADQARLPLALRDQRLDVLFSPGNLAPLASRLPQVVTVLDLQHRHFPQYFNWKRRAVRNALIPLSARRAARVIAISQATADDLTRFLHIPPEKVDITYLGVDQALSRLPRAAIEAVRAKYELPERFVFLPAKTFPHKNHITLLEALALLRDRGLRLPLILTGGADVAHEQVRQRLRDLALTDQVRHLGYVSYGEVTALYHLATILAYPSSFEGFGLPVLEAMVCGCPVVTANKMSLAEIVSDAALTVEPTDAGALADAIERLWRDDILREQLIARGRDWSARFTWERCAAETYAVLEKAVALGR